MSTSTTSLRTLMKDEKKRKVDVALLEAGKGTRLGTKLIGIVKWLKENPSVHRLEDLAIKSGHDDLLTNPELLAAFKSLEKVAYDEKTGLYRYKPEYDIQNREDLLKVLRQYLPRGGIPMKQLKESYPNAAAAVEDLEREGKLRTTRAMGGRSHEDKEGAIKMVFYDEIGRPTPMDQEFKDIWHSLRTPDAIDLPREMAAEGLKATATAAVTENANSGITNKKKRKTANRRVKITNTHVAGIDLTRDYPAALKK